MLVPFNTLQGQPLDASNGTIGRVRDFYFSADDWAIDYFLTDIGSWFSYYSVLLPAAVVQGYNRDEKTISVELTTLQVQLSPTLESNKSASKQNRMNGCDNVSLRPNVTELLPLRGAINVAPAEKNTCDQPDGRHQHLYSSEELRRNYTLRVCDGELSFVENFILQHDDEWQLRYLVIQISWWPGKTVLLPREYIEDISVERCEIVVSLPRLVVEQAPEYNSSITINGGYEQRLRDHYTQALIGAPTT